MDEARERRWEPRCEYRHLFDQVVGVSPAEISLLAVLMLRGPQTPGELKQRTERLHAFASLEQLQESLEGLVQRELVARLGRRPGQKEERYTHLLGGADPVEAAIAAPSGADRVGELEQRVARLEAELAELRDALSVRR